jgi:DNA-binding CsgD family transcriptional regulator
MRNVRKTLTAEEPILNIRQEKILEILGDGKIRSSNDIFDQLDGPSSLRTVKGDLATLKKLRLANSNSKCNTMIN